MFAMALDVKITFFHKDDAHVLYDHDVLRLVSSDNPIWMDLLHHKTHCRSTQSALCLQAVKNQ